MPYTHLTEDERFVIEQMIQDSFTPRQIARKLDRHYSTIYREIRRNRCQKTMQYLASKAQASTKQRRIKANHRYKINQPGPVGRFVRKYLSLHWSPDAIAGRLKKDNPNNLKKRISHETIYQWIYREWKEAYCGFWNYLHTQRKRRRKRHPDRSLKKPYIKGAVSIEQRPKFVDKRLRTGDWEGDLVEGRKGHGFLVTLIERKSRFSLISRINNKSAKVTRQAMIGLLDKVHCIAGSNCLKTLTLDNGREFSQHHIISEQFCMKVYFANPQHPEQRGSNEQFNGLIRRYFPKKCDLKAVSQHEVNQVMKMVNQRPRKILHYISPEECFALEMGISKSTMQRIYEV